MTLYRYLQSLPDDLREKKIEFETNPIKHVDDTRKDDLIKDISNLYHSKIANVDEYAKTIGIGILSDIAKKKKHLQCKISELNSKKQKLHSTSDVHHKKVKISREITSLENQIKQLKGQKCKEEIELNKVNAEISQHEF